MLKLCGLKLLQPTHSQVFKQVLLVGLYAYNLHGKK